MNKQGLKRFRVIKRDGELTIVPQQGIYNNPLFDLCADDALVSFTLMESYNEALDVIGFETSNVYKIERNMITYIGPSGTAAGSPTSARHSDPCAAGDGVEFGGANYQLQGWGRLRLTTAPRDLTNLPIRYCERVPTYNIGGIQIDDDYEWDLVQLNTVILQDFQREFIQGNSAVAGSHDGLAQLVTFGYEDPITGEEVTSMDSYVVDYNDNPMCPDRDAAGEGDNGTTGITVNGATIPDGLYDLYDFIAAWARRVRVRINNSPNLNGMPTHIGLLSNEHLNALIECWVCHTHCGGDRGQMFEREVQIILNEKKADLFSGGSVVMTFHGVAITFYPYDYGTIISTEVEEEGYVSGDIYLLTTGVGNTPFIRIQTKDMGNVASHPAASARDFKVTDNRRILSWEEGDHTCYTVSSEMQWRILFPAPWASMRITNVPATPVLGSMISGDPLSPFYLEQNLVRYPVANSSTFTALSAPVAADQMYARAVGATNLVVTAGNGLLRNSTGEPAPTVVPVVAAATTAGGAITIAADGSFDYEEPSGTFEGVDTYVFTVTNSQGTDTATVTIVTYNTAA